TVLVDQHRLMPEPPLPRDLRHVLVDPLAELARIRRLVETFGFGAEHYAMDGSGHAVSSPGAGSRSSNARIGAAIPRFDRAAALYQTRLSDSITAPQSVASLTRRGAIVRSKCVNECKSTGSSTSSTGLAPRRRTHHSCALSPSSSSGRL